MGLLNYTTKIDPDKTAQEIARILSTHGATAVMTGYDPVDNFVTALSFKIKLSDQQMSFRLPTDWRPVYEILIKGKRMPPTYQANRRAHFESEWKLQAVRTSWRIVKDRTEAQMALVETQMVTTAQVFLSYLQMRDGRTLSEHIATDLKFLLGSGD
jgi:hypothetical protein